MPCPTADTDPAIARSAGRCRAVTADTALRLGRALGMTAESWLALQRLHDRDRARARLDVSGIAPLAAAG